MIKSTHAVDNRFVNYLIQCGIAGLAGERTALSLIHPTRDWWTSRCWERTNSCTLKRDAARGRAYELRRGSPRWCPWGPTRRMPRKVRNTLTTHSTEWTVRVFHSFTKQATCYSKPCSDGTSDSLCFAIFPLQLRENRWVQRKIALMICELTEIIDGKNFKYRIRIDVADYSDSEWRG